MYENIIIIAKHLKTNNLIKIEHDTNQQQNTLQLLVEYLMVLYSYFQTQISINYFKSKYTNV